MYILNLASSTSHSLPLEPPIPHGNASSPDAAPKTCSFRSPSAKHSRRLYCHHAVYFPDVRFAAVGCAGQGRLNDLMGPPNAAPRRWPAASEPLPVVSGFSVQAEKSRPGRL